jgi:hypothetical protein
VNGHCFWRVWCPLGLELIVGHDAPCSAMLVQVAGLVAGVWITPQRALYFRITRSCIAGSPAGAQAPAGPSR